MVDTTTLAAIVSAGATVVSAVFVYRTWASYRRIEWFTGSQASLLMKQLQITWAAAHGRKVRLVWWDPSISDPPTNWVHQREVDARTIYLYVPEHLRAKRTGFWRGKR